MSLKLTYSGLSTASTCKQPDASYRWLALTNVQTDKFRSGATRFFRSGRVSYSKHARDTSFKPPRFLFNQSNTANNSVYGWSIQNNAKRWAKALYDAMLDRRTSKASERARQWFRVLAQRSTSAFSDHWSKLFRTFFEAQAFCRLCSQTISCAQAP